MFRHLVISWLFSPDSKHKTIDYLERYQGITYEIFQGNIFEGHTFIPALQNVVEKYSLGKPVIVADAGLLLAENCKSLIELERMLKHTKSKITVKRVQELTKTMYQLTYCLPKSRISKTKILGMDNEQQELYDAVRRWLNRK